jgi:hypothetical protein
MFTVKNADPIGLQLADVKYHAASTNAVPFLKVSGAASNMSSQ